MRKFIFIISLISNSSFNLFSQQTEPVKNSRQVIITYSDSVIYTYIPINKKNNIKTDKNKTYFWFSTSEIHSNKGGYSGSLLNGPYEVLNNTGNLMRKGFMNNGLPDDTWNYWNNEGQLIKTEEWDEGTLKEIFIYNSRGILVKSTDMQKKEEKEQKLKIKEQEKKKKSELKRSEKQQLKKQKDLQTEIPQTNTTDEPESKFKTRLKKFLLKFRNISLKKDKSQTNSQ
jgi:hypothetical protein